jgi:hypothetical protein
MATFTSKIYESITLNGNDLGSYTTLTIDGINYVDNRILNCPSGSQTSIFNLSNIPGAGQFVTSSIQYARITNSSTVPVKLIITGTPNISASFLVSTGSSFFLSTSKITSSVDNSFTFKDIQNVYIEPSGSSAVVEYYIATT